MTTEDRNKLLDALIYMVLMDFGEAPDDAPFNPFSPADIARQAVIMLQAAYDEFEDIDSQADQILSRFANNDVDSDNLTMPS